MTRGLALLALCAACSSSHEGSDPAAVRRDAERLRVVMAHDPATRALEEVDGFVVDRRPVLAAQTIDTGVLPAVRRQIETVTALSLATPEAQAAQDRAERAYRRRLASLEAWSHVLARGEVEDAELLAAVHEQRLAEQELVETIDAVEVLAGGHAGRAVPHLHHLHDGEE